MKKLIDILIIIFAFVLIFWLLRYLPSHSFVYEAQASEPYLVAGGFVNEELDLQITEGFIRSGFVEHRLIPQAKPVVKDALWELIQRESGWRVGVINKSSGACGLGQALPCSKMPPGCLGDYDCELQWTVSYIKNRYGSPEKALDFWNTHGWY